VVVLKLHKHCTEVDEKYEMTGIFGSFSSVDLLLCGMLLEEEKEEEGEVTIFS
jgi:hypothetical protein